MSTLSIIAQSTLQLKRQGRAALYKVSGPSSLLSLEHTFYYRSEHAL